MGDEAESFPCLLSPARPLPLDARCLWALLCSLVPPPTVVHPFCMGPCGKKSWWQVCFGTLRFQKRQDFCRGAGASSWGVSSWTHNHEASCTQGDFYSGVLGAQSWALTVCPAPSWPKLEATRVLREPGQGQEHKRTPALHMCTCTPSTYTCTHSCTPNDHTLALIPTALMHSHLNTHMVMCTHRFPHVPDPTHT